MIEQAPQPFDERDRLLAIAARVVHLGGWTVDLADGMEHLSDEVCAMHELPPGTALTAAQALAFYAPESRPLITAAFDACAKDGIPYDLELEMVTAKGRVISVREIGEAVRGPDGTIERVHGAFQDLSALREAEANAERSGARLVRTLENVTDAFYTLDREWRYTYVNPEAERMQGKSRAEMLGNVVWDVFPDAVGTMFDVEFHRAVETGAARVLRVLVRAVRHVVRGARVSRPTKDWPCTSSTSAPNGPPSGPWPPVSSDIGHCSNAPATPS